MPSMYRPFAATLAASLLTLTACLQSAEPQEEDTPIDGKADGASCDVAAYKAGLAEFSEAVSYGTEEPQLQAMAQRFRCSQSDEAYAAWLGELYEKRLSAFEKRAAEATSNRRNYPYAKTARDMAMTAEERREAELFVLAKPGGGAPSIELWAKRYLRYAVRARFDIPNGREVVEKPFTLVPAEREALAVLRGLAPSGGAAAYAAWHKAVFEELRSIYSVLAPSDDEQYPEFLERFSDYTAELFSSRPAQTTDAAKAHFVAAHAESFSELGADAKLDWYTKAYMLATVGADPGGGGAASVAAWLAHVDQMLSRNYRAPVRRALLDHWLKIKPCGSPSAEALRAVEAAASAAGETMDLGFDSCAP